MSTLPEDRMMSQFMSRLTNCADFLMSLPPAIVLFRCSLGGEREPSILEAGLLESQLISNSCCLAVALWHLQGQ